MPIKTDAQARPVVAAPSPSVPAPRFPSLVLTSASKAAWVWSVVALTIVIIGVLVRVRIHFAGAVPPGIDAGYYAVQTRWLLERGRLMFDDLPLIFWIDALTAKALMLWGLPIERAVLLASEWVDCLLPPLVAAPAMALGRAWSTRTKHDVAMSRTRVHWTGLCASAAGSSVCVLGPLSVRMVSDFEKNALGLVFAAWIAWALDRAIAQSIEPFDNSGKSSFLALLRRWWIVIVPIALVGLTHVGAAGACGVFVCVTIGVLALIRGTVSLHRVLAAAGVIVLAGGFLLGAVYLADSRRAVKLLSAPITLTKNSAISSFLRGTSGGPGGGPGDGQGIGLGMGPMNANPGRGRNGTGPMHDGPGPDMRGPGNGPGPGGGGGPGGPGGPGGANDLPFIIGTYTLVPIAMVAMWLSRKRRGPGEIAIAFGAGATALALACPLISTEYFSRLMLMSPLFASISIMAALCAPLPRRKNTHTTLAVIALLASLVFATRAREQRPGQLDAAALAELRSLSSLTEGSTSNLIMARHGLQYWAAFYMNGAGRNQEIPANALTKYARVFVVHEVASRRPGPRGFDRPGGPIGPRDRERPPEDDAGDNADDPLSAAAIAELFGVEPGMPERNSGPVGPRGPDRRGSPHGPGGAVRVPEGSELVFQGASFKVYRVSSAVAAPAH